MWVPQEELLRGPDASSTDSISAGFHSQKLWGFICLALESWAGRPDVGVGPARSTSTALDVVSSIL